MSSLRAFRRMHGNDLRGWKDGARNMVRVIFQRHSKSPEPYRNDAVRVAQPFYSRLHAGSF